jgi:hypothetical protein
MNLAGLKIDKAASAVIGLILAALLANALLLNALSETEGALASLQATHEEMLALKREYLALKEKIDAVEKRKRLTGVKGIVHAVDEIFEPLGLKGKVKSVKPLSTAARDKDGREETAEINVQGATMNEMVNVLYSMENAPMLLLLRKINIKPSFENPEMLNITMTISFIKP